MKTTISVELDAELASRAGALATRRGISVNQLIAQQLERLTSNDEYANARRRLNHIVRTRRNASERLLRQRIRDEHGTGK